MNYTTYGDNRPFIIRGKIRKSAPKARIIAEIEDYLDTHDVSLSYDRNKEAPIIIVTEKVDR